MTRDKMISALAKQTRLCMDSQTCNKHREIINTIIEETIFEVKERVSYMYEHAFFDSLDKEVITLHTLQEVKEAIEPEETKNSE